MSNVKRFRLLLLRLLPRLYVSFPFPFSLLPEVFETVLIDSG